MSKELSFYQSLKSDCYQPTCCALRKTDPGFANLLNAILKFALKEALCLKKPDHLTEPFRTDALEWIFSDSQELLSFINICELLEMDPYRLRKSVQKKLSKMQVVRNSK